MRNDQGQSQLGFNPRDSFGMGIMLANGHAACLTPFLRRGFGVNAFRVQGLIAALIIIIYAGFADCPEMGPFFMFWLLAVCLQRSHTNKLIKKGWVEHSRYSGYPWLAMKLPSVRDEMKAKGTVEPILCLIAGLFIRSASPALGSFVMFGAYSIGFQVALERRLIRQRMIQMRDAQIEQRVLSRQLKGGDEY